MVTRKNLILLGVYTYSTSILLMICLSFVVFILIPNIGDWEFFSYNVYGAVMFYGVAIVPYFLFALFIGLNRLKPLLVLIILMICMELAALFFDGRPTIVTIFTTKFTYESSIFIFYPIVLIISFFVVKKILNIDFAPLVQASRERN